MGVGVPLFRGQTKPLQGFLVVLGNAFAVGIHHPEVELGCGVSLICGQAEPLHRFPVVLGNAFAVGIHHPEVELGCGVSLICGQAEPLHRFPVVLGDALALVIHRPEDGLRCGVSLICGQAVPFQRRPVVLGSAQPRVIAVPKPALGFGVSLGRGRERVFALCRGTAAGQNQRRNRGVSNQALRSHRAVPIVAPPPRRKTRCPPRNPCGSPASGRAGHRGQAAAAIRASGGYRFSGRRPVCGC